MGLSQNQRLRMVKPEDLAPNDAPINRNIIVAGHRTSIRLEPVMWDALKEICRREHISLHEIATQIAATQSATASFTAAVRIFTMAYYRAAATEEGHRRAGHGSETKPGDTTIVPGIFRLPSTEVADKK